MGRMELREGSADVAEAVSVHELSGGTGRRAFRGDSQSRSRMESSAVPGARIIVSR
jgi:hypothetical protein